MPRTFSIAVIQLLHRERERMKSTLHVPVPSKQYRPRFCYLVTEKHH